MNIRATAVQILSAVIIDNRSLSESLNHFVNATSDPRDKAFLQFITYEVCRWYFQLEALLSQLLEKPLKKKDEDLKLLLLVGLYQLKYMRVPAHAAVAETVAATQALRKNWAKGLVNAVLRNYLRQAEMLEKNLQAHASASVQFSHPVWFVEAIQKSYPAHWQAILEANNQHPPFALRVNQRRISRDNYVVKLAKQTIEAQPIFETSAGIILQKPIDVQQLPGFLAGEVSVQDGAAQLAAELLQLAPHLTLLDACAAPGGKTAHLLEQEPTAQCTALEIDGERLTKIKENLTRLQLSAEVIEADAANLESWWQGDTFDRILLDAPCSATGVIRRHPDIKLLRQKEDISQLAQEQLRLLLSLWKVLKKDGVLLYATCSLLPEENSEVIKAFLKLTPEAKIDKINLPLGIQDEYGIQILPGMANMDGFYYSRLRK